MEVKQLRQSPKDYLDLTSGKKMYPQFCQELRRLHPKFILVKNPRAKKVPKQYIKVVGQPENRESVYEERWEIWKEVNEALKYVMCIFQPTYPETYKGVFKEPGTYEIDLLNKAKMYAELQMGIAMAQQDENDVIKKLTALDAKEEKEEDYQRKVQWEKDTDDMERDVKAGALTEKSYSFGPKEKASGIDENTAANMKTLALIKANRIKKAKEAGRKAE